MTQFIPTKIPEVILIEPRVFSDSRGFFLESYQKKRFAEAGIKFEFVQDNHSQSEQGILRGLHYQIQQPQGKLVRVISGEIFDVAVDLRRSSPTFGKWVGDSLSSENRRMLWVPPGFAHGFVVTSATAEVLYKATDYYAPHLKLGVYAGTPGPVVRFYQSVQFSFYSKISARLNNTPALSFTERIGTFSLRGQTILRAGSSSIHSQL